jgi:hypothetical protein
MTATAQTPWPPGDRESSRFLARAFADAPEDLDIAFGSTSRPALVTRLLASCLRDRNDRALPSDAAWDWTVSERLQGLLAIAHAGGDRMTQAVATCDHPGCGGRVELEMGIEAFASESATTLPWRAPDGSSLQLRLPSGRDLDLWLQHASEMTDAEAWLVHSLVERVDDQVPTADWHLPADWLVPLAAALADADPLTALTLDVTCPYCAQAVAVDVDLELLLIDGLRQRQARLTDEVHQLAAHYHWSERDIAALPSWRRRRYIAKLHAELA